MRHWQPVVRKLFHSRPRHLIFLAPSPKRFVPERNDAVAKAGQNVSEFFVTTRADPGVLFRLDLSGSRLRLDRLGPQRRPVNFLPLG
jgi:hypothetical protein